MAKLFPDAERSLRDEVRSFAFPQGFPVGWDPQEFEKVFQEALDPGVAEVLNLAERQALRQMFGIKALEQCAVRAGEHGIAERTDAIRQKLRELNIPESGLEETLKAVFGNMPMKKRAEELLDTLRKINANIRLYQETLRALEIQRIQVLEQYQQLRVTE